MSLPISGEYPPDWKDIATAVKFDAAGECIRCHEPHNPFNGYTLTVHHFDGNKSNCERWNLMALCQRCHLSVQARADPAVPLMFDPSIWAMPYVAGAYKAGTCEPSPGYDALTWRTIYEMHEGKLWPEWAP